MRVVARAQLALSSARCDRPAHALAPRARRSGTPNWKVRLGLNVEAAPQLFDAKLSRYDAPASAAQPDAPCFSVRCSEKELTAGATVVIKLGHLAARAPVVADAPGKTLTFHLAASKPPVEATVAGVGAVCTRLLTLTLSSDVAFERLTRWLDSCEAHHGVGGTTPSPQQQQRQPVFDSPAPAARASNAAADSAGRASALEERLAAMEQADFDRLLVHVLELRLQRRAS